MKFNSLILNTLAFILLLGATSSLSHGQETKLRRGQKMWRSCSNCHCVPDVGISQDEDWINLNLTTTCITGENATVENRKVLISYLRSKETRRPVLINEKSKVEEGKTYGQIKLPKTGGTAYLKASRQSVREGSPRKVRLHWQASKDGTTLQVPVGAYRVVNYGYHRTKGGKRWSLSASSAEGSADLVVSKKKAVAFSLLPALQGQLSATLDDKTNKFAFFMTNKGAVRMSIACNGALVNPTWRIQDKLGKIVEQGQFAVT